MKPATTQNDTKPTRRKMSRLSFCQLPRTSTHTITSQAQQIATQALDVAKFYAIVPTPNGTQKYEQDS